MTTVAGAGPRRRDVVSGSFTRSMMAAAVRGLGLVGVAVALGVVLLQVTDESGAPPPAIGTPVGSEPTTTTTTTAEDGSGGSDGGTLRPAGQVQVLVLNAARIEGAAGRTTEELEALGHPTLPPGNAPTQPDTIVFFKPGFELEAEAIADTVSAAAFTEPLREPPPFAGTENADVVVVLGTDFADAESGAGDGSGDAESGAGDGSGGDESAGGSGGDESAGGSGGDESAGGSGGDEAG